MNGDGLGTVRRQLHERLLERVDARGLEAVPRAERRLRVREEALEILRTQGHILPQRALTRIVNEVSDAVVGLGPIEFLLKDPDVSEVMAERSGCRVRGVGAQPRPRRILVSSAARRHPPGSR